jgi:hypothetical protein
MKENVIRDFKKVQGLSLKLSLFNEKGDLVAESSKIIGIRAKPFPNRIEFITKNGSVLDSVNVDEIVTAFLRGNDFMLISFNEVYSHNDWIKLEVNIISKFDNAKLVVLNREDVFYDRYDDLDEINSAALVSAQALQKEQFSNNEWALTYVLQEVVPERHGEYGVFLLSEDGLGAYGLKELSSLYIDVNGPRLIHNAMNLYFSYSSPIDGALFLGVKEFAGSDVYKVPFVGIATGDIKEVYIAGQRVDFKIDQEFYIKKNLRLDQGYNRVPIKLIDHLGNITEDYVPISISPVYDEY